MDAFDFTDDSPEKPKRELNLNFAGLIWDLATVLFLVSALFVGGWFVAVFLNPQSGLNPWSPVPVVEVTLPPIATLPPAQQSEATATPETPSPVTAIPTDIPTATSTTQLLPTPTETILITSTPTEPSNGGGLPYEMQVGNPIYLASTIYHPDLGCSFLGVGGQAFDMNGSPVQGFIIRLTGTLNGDFLEFLTRTGAATQYGPGGYEIKISDQPAESTNDLRIVLLDQESVPISEPVFFDTFDDCNRNVVLINFVESP
ncbi:MAG: hypothetical protein FVQ83_03025 [Chloroflexi bacterium]|nr:hypothetical protein [Chloroflexota bacterium]